MLSNLARTFSYTRVRDPLAPGASGLKPALEMGISTDRGRPSSSQRFGTLGAPGGT